MATSTIYIPLDVVKNNKLYSFHKQFCYGNTQKAKEEKKNIKKEFPEPNFLIKQKKGYLTIYKK